MPAIQVDCLSRSFGDRPILRGVTLTVETGECVVIVGSNGSGKTTLLEIIATLLAPTSGRASVHGRDIVKENVGVRELLGYCSSRLDSFYPRLTARANLRFFASLYGIDDKAACARIESLLDQVELRAAGSERVQAYSDGMKARLSIARALLTDAPVLLLDEPSKSLDQDGKLLVRSLFSGKRSATRGKTCLWVTHDSSEASAVADRVLELSEGHLHATEASQA